MQAILNPDFCKRIGRFFRTISFGLMALLVLPACSVQWMETESGVEPDAVLNMIDEISEGQGLGVSSTEMSEFLAIKEDPNSTLYFAYAPSDMGPVVSISGISRYDFMGATGQGVFFDTIENVRVVFAYLPDYAGNKGSLLIDIQLKGEDQYRTKVFSQLEPPFIEDGVYTIRLGDSAGGEIVLRSEQVTDGELEPVIQLEAFDFDPQTGEEVENGKFSVLEGFGPS